MLREVEDSGAALPDAIERKAEIEQKISFLEEAEAITVAQPSMEPVSRSPLFIIVIGVMQSVAAEAVGLSVSLNLFSIVFRRVLLSTRTSSHCSLLFSS